MKNKKIYQSPRNFGIAVFLVGLFFSHMAYANSIIVDVKGLVCEFCAVTIEKSFKKKQEVQAVKVDLESKRVTIDLKENQQLSDGDVKNIIVNNGYHVTKIARQ